MPHRHPSLPLEIARRLRDLADDMDRIAMDLSTCPGLPDGSDRHTHWMTVVAPLVRQWSDTLQAHVAEARDDG